MVHFKRPVWAALIACATLGARAQASIDFLPQAIVSYPAQKSASLSYGGGLLLGMGIFESVQVEIGARYLGRSLSGGGSHLRFYAIDTPFNVRVLIDDEWSFGFGGFSDLSLEDRPPIFGALGFIEYALSSARQGGLFLRAEFLYGLSNPKVFNLMLLSLGYRL